MLNANNAPQWGSDPELFFSKGGQIIGSEKLIPERGIRTGVGKIVRDGVQFELNPLSDPTVRGLGNNIANLLARVQVALNENPGVELCYDGLVEVSREELDSLTPKSRVLGCMPSYNVYEDRPITVDPITYQKRSSGGHIHIGTSDPVLMFERRSMVPIFDIIVGNTCVLLDRDGGAAERRQNYGRAGECRFPDHGLEYRTTSNFWLRDYSLMSLVFGMAHIAYEIAYQGLNGNRALLDDLSKRVNIKRIVQAIDTNDFDLALRNFKRIVPFLRKNLPQEGFVLNSKNIISLILFAENVNAYGIEYYFPTQRILENWTAGNHVDIVEFLKG